MIRRSQRPVPNNRIQVWKFEGKSWVQVGNDIPLKFVDGDVFTVFAGKDGTVEITRNGRLLSTRQPAVLPITTPMATQPSQTPTMTEAPIKQDASVPQLANFAPVSLKLPAPLQQSGPVTIDYIYDPLYRLTEANYSTGDYYHYSYDTVGNRLTQETLIGNVPLTNTYTYDAANRLTSVDSVAYAWDNNGNLLNDGVNTYAYDSANRLIAISGQQSATYSYNGIGDRLQQTVNGNTTSYALDINASLPEVLSDGEFTYLYGLDNIAQVNAGGTQYFLGDALNSTRQLTDASGEITLAQSYDPFGSVIYSMGNGQSVYGYTSEQVDPSGLVFLRSRYYSPNAGRFISKDTWAGDANLPMTYNKWLYVNANPVMYTDPSGHCFDPATLPICLAGLALITTAGILANINNINSDVEQMESLSQHPMFWHEQQVYQNWQDNCYGLCHYPYAVNPAPNSSIGGPRPVTPLLDQYSAYGGDAALNTILLTFDMAGLKGLGRLGLECLGNRYLGGLSIGVPDEFLPPSMTGQYRNWSQAEQLMFSNRVPLDEGQLLRLRQISISNQCTFGICGGWAETPIGLRNRYYGIQYKGYNVSLKPFPETPIDFTWRNTGMPTYARDLDIWTPNGVSLDQALLDDIANVIYGPNTPSNTLLIDNYFDKGWMVEPPGLIFKPDGTILQNLGPWQFPFNWNTVILP